MSDQSPAVLSALLSVMTPELARALLDDISKISEQSYRRGYEQGGELGAPYARKSKRDAIHSWRYDLGGDGDYAIAQGPPHEPGFTTTSLERLEMEYRYAKAPLVEALFDSLPTGSIQSRF